MPADKDDIRAIVSMQNVLELYGVDTSRRRTACPIHNGKDLNFSFKENSFMCHSQCGGGDIFKFVQLMNNCDFQTALSIICAAFNIPNSKQSTPSQQQAVTARRKQAEERKERIERGKYTWNRLCAYRHYLTHLEGYTPERFHNLDWIDYVLDSYLSDMEGLALFLPYVDSWLKTRHAKYSKMKP